MKKNRYNEIRKSIDSLTALLICAEKEREWLKSTLNLRLLGTNDFALHVANEKELVDIADAYDAEIVHKEIPFAPDIGYTEELTIEVNGIKLYTLA